MSLTPALFALFAALLFSVASSRLVQDSALLTSQQAAQLLALQRATAQLARVASLLADPDVDAAEAIRQTGDGAWEGIIESLPVAADAELEGLPLPLQRVTVVGAQGGVRLRLQADFAIDGCESAYDTRCVSRVRQIALRNLGLD